MVAIGAALLAAPLAVVIAGLSAVLIGRPVLYRQDRGGVGGSTFEIVKFRTMTDERGVDGDLLPDEFRRHPWGTFLRKSSLDELPTLLNVIRGDMSIVGPRPLMAKYLPRYSNEASFRHCVTPGLTGLAQTQGRNELGWSEKFELDLEYVASRSVKTDLRILRDTVLIVLRRTGADGVEHTTEFTGEIMAVPAVGDS